MSWDSCQQRAGEHIRKRKLLKKTQSDSILRIFPLQTFTVALSPSHHFIFGRHLMWAVNSGNQIEPLYYLDCMAEPNGRNLIMFVQSDFYVYISEVCAVSLTSWIMCMLSSVLNVVHFPNPFGRFSDVTWGRGVFMVFKYLTHAIYASGLKKKKSTSSRLVFETYLQPGINLLLSWQSWGLLWGRWWKTTKTEDGSKP